MRKVHLSNDIHAQWLKAESQGARAALAARELERALSARSTVADLTEDARLIRSEVDRCQLILDQMSGRGLGLGLFLARMFAERLGGMLTLEVGNGTSAILELPIRSDITYIA